MKSTKQKETYLLNKQLADLALFPDMNPGPVFRLTLHGEVILANKAARKLFGKNDLTGTNWVDMCPDFSADMWKQVIETKESLSLESYFNGQCIVFNYVLPEKRDFVFAFGTDITDRKNAEKLLAEIARFPDLNPAPVLRFDMEGYVLLANSAAHDIFGEDLNGKCWRNICPGLKDNRVWKSIHEATDKPYYIEAHIGEKDFIFAHRSDPQNSLLFAFGADVTQHKTTERLLRQSEKMATLGTLAAGIAHELNNPAAAIRRASEQLQETFTNLEESYLQLSKIGFSVEQDEILQMIEQRAKQHSVQPEQLDSIIRSDCEVEIENWINDHNMDNAWELAPLLVDQGYNTEVLIKYYDLFGHNGFIAVLQWIISIYPVYALVNEISQGAGRISEIVGAMKGYSYLGQAPIQYINVHEGIDNTLIILKHKLKNGINVIKEYKKDLPLVNAYGSELNQVWTNILDNAIDVMEGEGQIIIRTFKDNSDVRVEIEDNGPGIPQEIQAVIFDPFFTTKDPGKGTGLGLSTSYSIICERHKGKISFTSQPGKTCFIITLPIK